MSKHDRNKKFKSQYPRYVTVQRLGWQRDEVWEIVGETNPGTAIHCYNLKSTKTGEKDSVWAVCTRPAVRENIASRKEFLNRMSENAQNRRDGRR